MYKSNLYNKFNRICSFITSRRGIFNWWTRPRWCSLPTGNCWSQSISRPWGLLFCQNKLKFRLFLIMRKRIIFRKRKIATKIKYNKEAQENKMIKKNKTNRKINYIKTQIGKSTDLSSRVTALNLDENTSTSVTFNLWQKLTKDTLGFWTKSVAQLSTNWNDSKGHQLILTWCTT